jgi:hypothetical protein
MELLVTLGVLAIVLPAFGAVVANYYHVYGQYLGRAHSSTQLAMAHETLFRHISHMSRGVALDDHVMAFRIPRCDAEGRPLMPINRNGVLLALYLSDASGSTSYTGPNAKYLWLGRGDVGSATFVPHGKPLASKVESLTFEYFDASGNAIPRATRIAAGFDDTTVSRIRVTISVTDPAQTDAGLRTDAHSGTTTMTIAPRNNHN